jgi:hypothetical protein
MYTNADSKITPAERRQRERDECNDALIQEAIDRAKPLGGTSRGKAGGQIVATYDQLGDRKAYRATSRGVVEPAHVKSHEGLIVAKYYTKADYAALEAGHYCLRCGNLQDVPADPEWAVTAPKPCRIIGKSHGCGFPKGWQFRTRLPFHVLCLPDS